MKKITFILFVSVIALNIAAQEKEEQKGYYYLDISNRIKYSDGNTKADSTKTIEVNKTLTSGDYLVYSSNNIWIGIGSAIIGSFFLYQANRMPNENNKGTLNALGYAFGAIAIINFPIAFTINLRKAGKKYNAEILLGQN